MSTTVVSSNLVFTLDGHRFEIGLRLALADNPDICALQEAGPNRDHIIEKVAAELGYSWARAKGGGVVLWKVARYGTSPRWVKPVRLARAEYVGHLIGRKDRLPASICTEVGLNDLKRDGLVTVVEDYHLTADIEDAKHGGYKKGLRYFLRVMRHKHEKRRLGRRSRMHERNGREVYDVGDGNFDRMPIGGFINCWEDREGGTLGWRAVDAVHASRKPSKLWTIETPSDHDTLVVVYP